MFSINEWLERYEVNDKGQPAKKGDKLRVRPLDYIRSKIHGRDEGAGFHAMRCIAKSRTWEVFGIFQKFLEIAGKSGPENRGKLLNQRGDPATISDLAHILRTTEAKVRYALQVLTNTTVAWIGSDSTCGFPEIPGNPGALYNETEGKGTEEKERKKAFLDHVLLTTDEHAKLVKKFGSDETVRWIEKLDSYIGSKGTKYKSHYKTIINWSLKDDRGTPNTKRNSQRTELGRDFEQQQSQYGKTIDV